MNIQTGRKLVSIIAVLAMGMLSPLATQAGCVQSDLDGTWYAYAATMMRCKIDVNSSGSIVSSKSSCSMRDETGRFSLDVGGGNLGISNACLMKGKMKICDARCVGFKIEHGRLERDKNMLILEGYFAVEPDVTITLVGVKK